MPNNIRRYLETPREVEQRHKDNATAIMLLTGFVFLAWLMLVGTLIANYIITWITI